MDYKTTIIPNYRIICPKCSNTLVKHSDIIYRCYECKTEYSLILKIEGEINDN